MNLVVTMANDNVVVQSKLYFFPAIFGSEMRACKTTWFEIGDTNTLIAYTVRRITFIIFAQVINVAIFRVEMRNKSHMSHETQQEPIEPTDRPTRWEVVNEFCTTYGVCTFGICYAITDMQQSQ